MRRARTTLLAYALGLVVAASAVLFAALRNRAPVAPGAGAPPPIAAAVPAGGAAVAGAAVYARLGCPRCHSIGGVGNRRLPLDGVGARLPPDDLRRWVVAPEEMKPGVRKPRYDDTPASDLDALVAYLAALR